MALLSAIADADLPKAGLIPAGTGLGPRASEAGVRVHRFKIGGWAHLSSPTRSTGRRGLKAKRVGCACCTVACSQTGSLVLAVRSYTTTRPSSVAAAKSVEEKGAQATSPTGAPKSKDSTAYSKRANVSCVA